MKRAFFGCTNLNVVATDSPDLSLVTSTNFMFAKCTALKGNDSFNDWNTSAITAMSQMFRETPNFNKDIGNWDVSKVRSMVSMFSYSGFNKDISNWKVSELRNSRFMFKGNTAFNQDLSQWNMTNVNRMNGMFYDASSFNQDLSLWNIAKVRYDGTTKWAGFKDLLTRSGLSNTNYDKLLIGWSRLADLKENNVLDAPNNQYCFGVEEREFLVNELGWIINDAGVQENCNVNQKPFVTNWKTDNLGASDDNQITIPVVEDEEYKYYVDWGDGTFDINVSGGITHTYQNSGEYQVSIKGKFPRIFFNNTGDKAKIIAVEQWGDIEWGSMKRAFFGCTNLNVVATDSPDLTLVTSTNLMFAKCIALTGNDSFKNWNTSSITAMSQMFRETPNFNQNIGDWDVSKVKSMVSMFSLSGFNQDISNWEVSDLRNSRFMFKGNTAFNQDLSQWNMAKVNRMNGMFNNASSFNQDLSFMEYCKGKV